MSDGRRRRLVDALSALRFVVGLGFAAAVLAGQPGWAFPLWSIAVASDVADGWLARRLGTANATGELLDHSADAFFVVCALAALGWRGSVTSWLAPLVALAFVQYVVDSRGAPGAPLRRNRLGRWNGLAYYALAGLGLADLWASGVLDPLVAPLSWMLVGSTSLSIALRIRTRLALSGRPNP